MPLPSLAEYRDAIAEQIEDGHVDEAIAQCRHVLSHYPRYIPAYKLLAHACLEKGDFAHANHFFQCVLSVDLEDADAWTNLALLAQDLGETEQAIWLLERAFELTPGDTHVREILRQLYVQRDGAERTRIKLTPTALARLYAKSGFYRRAAHELEKMLKESSSLPRLRVATLEVGLAKALWHLGDRASRAAEVCESLLQKVPSSLQANLILGAIRASEGRNQEAESHLRIAQRLDPEGELAYELLGNRSPLPQKEIKIPSFEYKAPPMAEAEAIMSEPEDTSWLDRIGESVEPLVLEDDQEAPAWIKSWAEEETVMPTDIDQEPLSAEGAEPEPEGTSPGVEPAQDAEPEIPDWLLEAQRESTASDEEEGMPDWLRNLSEETPDEDSLPQPLEEELPDWLQELAPKESAQAPAQEEEQPTLQGELPEWLLELSQSEEEEEAYTAPPPTPEEELADFIEEQATLPPADQFQSHKSTRPLRPSPVPEEEARREQEKTVPGWLDDLRQEAETAEPTEPENQAALSPVAESTDQQDIPDWLRELSAEDEIEALDTEAAEKAEAIVPTIDVDEPRAEPTLPPVTDQTGTMEATPPEALPGERPAWLQELEAEIAGEEMPEEPSPVAAPETGEPPTPSMEAAAEAVADSEQPEWLSKLDETTAPEEIIEAAPSSESEIPDWLQELERIDEMEEAALPASEQEDLSAGEVQEQAEETALEADLEPMLDEELPGWLRELRAEPALPETLDRTEPTLEPTSDEELPDWLQELRPVAQARPDESPAPAAERPPAQATEPQELPAEEEAERAPTPIDEMEELDWLQELERAAPADERRVERKPSTAPLRLPTSEREEPEEAPIGPPPVPEPPAEPVLVEAVSPTEEPVQEDSGTERRLALARTHLSRNALDESAQEYERLVQEPDLARDLIEELEESTQAHPNHSALQRVLGDAYMRTGQLQKALNAYRQALARL